MPDPQDSTAPTLCPIPGRAATDALESEAVAKIIEIYGADRSALRTFENALRQAYQAGHERAQPPTAESPPQGSISPRLHAALLALQDLPPFSRTATEPDIIEGFKEVLEAWRAEPLRLRPTAPRPDLAARLLPLVSLILGMFAEDDDSTAEDLRGYMETGRAYARDMQRILREPSDEGGEADGPSRMSLGIELAWGLIANAYGGDWDKATDEWSEAAGRWRDNYVGVAVSENGEGPLVDPPSLAEQCASLRRDVGDLHARVTQIESCPGVEGEGEGEA